MDDAGAKILAAEVLKKAVSDHFDYQGCPVGCGYRKTCNNANNNETTRFLISDWCDTLCGIAGVNVYAYREMMDRKAAEERLHKEEREANQ